MKNLEMMRKSFERQFRGEILAMLCIFGNRDE